LTSAPEPVALAPSVPVSAIGEAGALALLEHGELEVLGRMVDASNATMYCAVTLDGVTAACVHKPVAGERPLWDFPNGTLAAREVAAYRMSAVTGWDVVPPTVLREGPWGPGMCQLWVDVDAGCDLVALLNSDDDRVRRMAVFDAVVNNADRKGGHLLPTGEGHVYGIDHGVCFAVPDKLRTLLWRWAGRPLPAQATDMLAGLLARWDTAAGPVLGGLLAPDEVTATRWRVAALLRSGVHPSPREDGWPAVPWPPF
jgi:uncharacterized repeat protein (TIGR03843 family)